MKMKVAVVFFAGLTLILSKLFGLKLLWIVVFPICFFVSRFFERHEIPNVLRAFFACLGGVLLAAGDLLSLVLGVIFVLLGIFVNDEPVRHVYHNRGVIVLAGFDGAGKSTHAQYISEWLKKKGHVCRIVHFSDYIFLTKLSKLKSGKLNQNDWGPYRKPPSTKGSKLWFIRPYLAFLDNLLKYILEVVPAVWRGEYVVCDRFIWNAYLKHKGLGYTAPLLFELSILIKPKCGVILDVPYEIAARRVVERGWYHPPYTLDHYKIEREEFRKLRDRLGYPVVNTTAPLKEVHEKIISLISEWGIPYEG